MSWFTDALKGAAKGLVGGLPGAAIGLGTSVIGSLISNKQAKNNQNAQNEWQAEQAQIARDWQSDQAAQQNAWSEKMNLQQQAWQEGMWNKTNEWNSEGARMQRLLDSGVNPNNAAGLISGNQSVAQLAQQPQIPSANPLPSTSIPNGGQFAGAGLDLAGGVFQGMAANKEMSLLDAQRENIEADTLGKLKNVESTDAQMKLWEKQGQLLDIDILNKPKEYEAIINQANQMAADYAAKAHLSESEATKLDYIIENILPLEKQLSEGKIKLTQQELKESVGRTAALFAQASLAYAQAKTEGKKQDLLEKQAQGQGIENTIKGIDALFEFGDKLLGRKLTAEQIKNLKFTNNELAYAKKFLAANGVPMSILDSAALPDFIKLGMLANVDGFGGNAEQIGDILYMKNTGESLQGLVGTGFQIVATAAGSLAGGVGAGVGAGMAAGIVSKGHVPGALDAPPYRNSSTTTWNWNH